EIRNDSVGHPTRRGGAPGRAFNFISRVSMSRSGFDLLTVRADGTQTINAIDLPALINDQRALIESALQTFVAALRADEAAHRERFRDVSVAGAFPHTLGWVFEKIFEEIEGRRSLGIGTSHVEQIREAIDAFERILTERGELPAIDDVVKYRSEPARHGLKRLEEYFSGNAPQFEKADAHAFRDHVISNLDGLNEIAKELDEKYQTVP
ncbi:MAG TPA: hypothetical protein VLU25_19760, partial [Acidobacteriota bacterium]|nr:hypothetical protein [Acidobacteriota bacterium]